MRLKNNLNLWNQKFTKYIKMTSYMIDNKK